MLVRFFVVAFVFARLFDCLSAYMCDRFSVWLLGVCMLVCVCMCVCLIACVFVGLLV